MIITDKEVLRQLRIVRIPELREHIESYEEDEIEGRTQMEILKEEAEYLLYDMYNEEGNIYGDDLREAREWLRETKNGTQYRLLSLEPSFITQCENKTLRAKNTVNEYKRLCNLVERLRRM